MSDNKFIFGYIKSYFNKVQDYLQNNNIIFLYGESRIGKTYLAQLCMSKVTDTKYYKLHLRAYDGYNPSYYAFSLGLVQSDALYETGREIMTDIISNSNMQSIKAIETIIKYSYSYKRKIFSYLNDSEISIINRINIHCRNRALFLVVDDYEKWDEASKKLLSFFLTNEAQKVIPFLKCCKIIIIGENENCINEIKGQIANIASINIKGYPVKEPFIEEFLKINSSSNNLAESLYQITNGNLGMAYDLSCYMEENSLVESISSQFENLKAKQLFLSIIDKRVNRINETVPKFITTIKAASIQGIVFEQKYLPDIINENEFAIERVLSIAQKEHFLSIVNNRNILYSFINNYIYQYFDEHYNEYKKEYHYKFACAAKKIHPCDYYTQYLHLRAAGKNFEAAENLVIHLSCQNLKNNIIDNTLLDYVCQTSAELYNNYLILAKSINNYNCGLYKEALASLELITPISEMVYLEKEYLTAYFIYDGWINERNVEACDILVDNLDNLLDSNFDMWLRSGLLLYIFYVNRLHNDIEARNIEKKIMKEIAKKYRDDSSLEMIVQILNRNASALYSVEIALLKTKKSVDYFKNYVHTLPLEYIYASTNYSGLLLVASEYEKGFLYAKKIVDFICEKNIWIKDIEKIINNYLVNGVMAGKISHKQTMQICAKLMGNIHTHKSILIKNNYYIFKTLAGDYDGLLDEMEKLFFSDSVQKHNDYYIYLIGTNYIFISILMGKFSVARKIYDILNEIIPAICSNEKYIIKRRYELLNDIICKNDLTFMSIKFLEEYFFEKLKDISSDYAKKPYILTDQQFWSVI